MNIVGIDIKIVDTGIRIVDIDIQIIDRDIQGELKKTWIIDVLDDFLKFLFYPDFRHQ